MPTLPNLLTFYRLGAAPVAAGLALAGYRDAFFILILISLFTDLVNGWIARRLGQGSGAGARLDTVADAATVLAAILGVVVFEGAALRAEAPWLILFLASYGGAAVVSLVRFRGLPAYHLYLSKAAEFVAGLFFIWLFVIGYAQAFFLAVVWLGTLANFESILVTVLSKRFRADIGSVLRLRTLPRDDS